MRFSYFYLLYFNIVFENLFISENKAVSLLSIGISYDKSALTVRGKSNGNLHAYSILAGVLYFIYLYQCYILNC